MQRENKKNITMDGQLLLFGGAIASPTLDTFTPSPTSFPEEDLQRAKRNLKQ